MKKQDRSVCVHDAAVEALGREILEGAVSPGHRFTMEGLEERFGLTHTGGRALVHALEALGLITPRKGLGLFVNAQSHWNLGAAEVISWRLAGAKSQQQYRELAQMRVAFEPLAAGGAAVNAPDRVKVRLLALASELYAAFEREDWTVYADVDIEFHALVLEHCGNAMFAGMVPIVEQSTKDMGVPNYYRPNHRAVCDHLDVAEAIAQGDPVAAERHSLRIAAQLRAVAGLSSPAPAEQTA